MSLKSFFKENNLKIEKVDYVASDRFKDEKSGNPIVWEIKILSNKEIEKLTKEHTKIKFINHKKVEELDQEAFGKDLLVKCILYPNLHDSELQDSYGLMDAYELLEELLTAGELGALAQKVNELHSYAENRVDEIKK